MKIDSNENHYYLLQMIWILTLQTNDSYIKTWYDYLVYGCISTENL